MKRFVGAVLAAGLVFTFGRLAPADDNPAAKAVIDKAISALGGADKLAAVKAVTWKSKGKITYEGNENKFNSQTTLQDLDHFRQEFEGEFGGNPIKGTTVLAGAKAWRKIGDDSSELDGDQLANQKRIVYLQLVPATILPLKEKSFKIESVTDDKIDGKPAIAFKVVGPDGKDFKIIFDKESGLPIKTIATVLGFTGDEFTQETVYGDYKDVGGIKRATKVELKRDGMKFIEQELSDIKSLDKVDSKAFAEP